MEARRQHVKLQLLITVAGECISTVFECIIKQVPLTTTGGQWPGAQLEQNRGNTRVQACDESYASCLYESSISSATDC